MIYQSLIENIGVLKNIQKVRDADLVLSLQGASIGEKVLSIKALNGKTIFIAKDLPEKINVINGLECLGIKCSEYSTDLNAPIYMPIKNNEIKINLTKNLYDFLLSKTDVLVLTPENLFQKFYGDVLSINPIYLKQKEDICQSEIIKKLIEKGYKKTEKIEKIGEFSVKGDILDVFPINLDSAIRLDFFGDFLDNINYFNLSEMTKGENVDSIEIYPTNIYCLTENQKQSILSKLKTEALNSGQVGESAIKIHTLLNQISESLSENTISADVEFLEPFMGEEKTIFDLFQNAKIIISEPKVIMQEIQEMNKSVTSNLYDFYSSGELLSIHLNYFNSPENIFQFKPKLIFSNMEQKFFESNITEVIQTVGARSYVHDYKLLVKDLNIYKNSNTKVIMFCGSSDSKSSISEFLVNNNIYPTEELKHNSNKFQVYLSENDFPYSCSFLKSSYILIGYEDIIKKSKKTISSSKKNKVFYLPKIGEYVVHNFHGIGKCIDLKKLNFNGVEKDYYIIEYLNGDKLYLPTEQADLISAYMGADADPKLNIIGGSQFAKVKQKVKESITKLAESLVKLYSAREKQKGFKYSENNYLYSQFEEDFQYEETEDQLQAIADITKDMESGKIMDRLVCGDVGYGKTEVALRAAFKTILDGKQVAFLCPTTILSQQHFQTALARFKNFAINIEVINRFKTKQQQDQITSRLADGKIDLIIGTHRLLSDDIVFKDLGLLILDEEQRFGVKDKEKLKEIKSNVNVLTLSATPIPRTLNMALTGIRDISIISTPPKERISVKTYVCEETDSLIANACKKEVARGGQILYLFNRVEGIYDQAERLKQLLPNLRIGVAHGQMPTKMLEDTVLKLYNKEFDILVATTLIESGIDLPSANTLIVVDSDRLGLSEMYQLKGRIGRSDKLAFAYFTYNPAKILTQDAYKRLDAIVEYSELGSGFKIAMRDLEIRGAGNVLGKEQHGHMQKIGYDMYCKLLAEAIKEVKGEKVKELKPIKIDVELNANIPITYIASEEERIKTYATISAIGDYEDYIEELRRLNANYGTMPIEVESLIKIAYLKNLASKIDIKTVQINKNTCKLCFYPSKDIIPKEVSSALSEVSNGVLKFEDMPIIYFELECSVSEKLEFALNFLKKCINVKN